MMRDYGTVTIRLATSADAPDMAEVHMRSWEIAENTTAIKFYEKCGFAPDGKTKTYDIGKAMACIRMRRDW